MASFGERLIGAAKLDVGTYEEVEADTSATPQAMGVVVLSSLAAGVGTYGEGGIKGMLFVTVAALIGWFIWAGLTYLIGTKIPYQPVSGNILLMALHRAGHIGRFQLSQCIGVQFQVLRRDCLAQMMWFGGADDG